MPRDRADPSPPPLPHAEEKRLLEILRDAEASARLSEWERKFCDDMLGRVTTYSIWTEVSPRQREVVERIERKLYDL